MTTATLSPEAPPSTGFSAIFNRKELAHALSSLAIVVKAKTHMPILKCVKISSSADGTTIEATNRELWAKRRLESVQSELAGTILLDHFDLRRAIDALTSDTATIRTTDTGTAQIVGDFRHTLSPFPVKDYPPSLTNEGTPSGVIESKDLIRLISQTDIAREREITASVSGGFWVSATATRLRIASSNGKQLHDTFAAWTGKKVLPVVVSAQTLHAVKEMADDDEISITITDGRAGFSGDGWELSGPLFEGRSPEVDDVIPKEYPFSAVAGREALMGAIKQASSLLEGDKAMRFAWDAKGLSLSARNEGRQSEGTLLLKYTGDPLTIGFRADYLIDALSVATADEVTVALIAPNRPAMITAGPDFRAVIMPFNLT